MKPLKAIEILKLAISDPDLVNANDLVEAQQLGIEALDRLKSMRENLGCFPTSLLPSEDPE